MKTKERILAKSLELFNQSGIKEVTLRKIAGELGMSQGNLNYHFKTKDEIVSALYYELVEKMDREMATILIEQPMIKFLYESTFLSTSILYEYRFILNDLYKVLQSDEELEKHYKDLQVQREQQFLGLFQVMIAQGLLREEEFSGEYSRLYIRMNILGDNWTRAASFSDLEEQDKLSYYHGIMFELIYPYLTEQGQESYREIVGGKE